MNTNYFSAVSGDMTIQQAVQTAFLAGYQIVSASGDHGCYIVQPLCRPTPEQVHPKFQKENRHAS